MRIELANVEQVKNYLGITNVSDDALLTRLTKAASGFIQTWLNRDLGQSTYTETRNGTGGDTMLFVNYPVTDVAAVTINGASIPPSPSAMQRGFVHDDNALYLRNATFERGRLNVSLTYTAGYPEDEVPAELTQACIELVANRYREKDRIGLVSKGLAGETITFSMKDMPNDVRTVLQNYKKVAPL